MDGSWEGSKLGLKSLSFNEDQGTSGWLYGGLRGTEQQPSMKEGRQLWVGGSQGNEQALVLVMVFLKSPLGVTNSGRIWVSGAEGSLANGHEK